MKDWKKDLSDFFNKIEEKERDKEKRIEKKKPEVESFYLSKVNPAFKELKTELEKYGREVVLLLENIDIGTASIIVRFKGKQEFSYSMRVKTSQDRVSPRPSIYCRRYLLVMSSIKDSSRMSDISKDDIIQDFRVQYESCLSGKI